ncbi:hypothetical protein [Nannocystis radixulma]|uniref:DUF4440 domain-containing protein n=1 Tax=Nannocystis radixulma TaxID=2995305 RepID=A0ABT5BFV1_9BACT|nr:hypothetical protein [Nannocystis radixulma]MDC0673022.1 hypothetical protein [Nannocystis radixulma]
MSHEQELSDLLAQTLTVDDMRRLSRGLPNGGDLAIDLPEGAMDRGQFAFQLVDLLKRRGLIDAALFERWVKRVPAQRAKIEAVARAWAIALPPPAETRVGVPRTSRRVLFGAGAAVILLIAGIGFSFTQREPERVCFAGRNGVPEIAHAACASYLDTVRAYNERDLARYHAGFAAPMECFYNHGSTEIGKWRPELPGSLDVTPASVSFLRVEGEDRVVLCDLGVHDRNDGKGRQPHNKVVVMTKRGGDWKIAVETSRADTKCYQSPC